MTSKRLLLVVTLMFLFASLMMACGTNSKKDAASSSSAEPSSSQSSSAEPSSAEPKESDKVTTLTVMTNVVGEPAAVLEAIARDFEKENPNIKVEFSAPGSEYENIMKVKMAAGDLPDVFSTHGWSQIRYGEFLADLRDESWAANLDPAISPAVVDANGKVYALPIDQDKSGPVYNKDVLEKYGVQVPTTWDEFLAAAETIKTKSNGEVIPLHIGGADSWPVGQFFDFMATPMFISPKQNLAQEHLDGTLNWRDFDALPQMFLDLYKNGYLNKDVLTSKYNDSVKAFAEGKVAFGFYGPYLIEEAKLTNPGLKAGLMPIPSVAAGDVATFAGGEKTTWGVYKDSPNQEAAKAFVAYYAKPENVQKVAAINSLPPGLKGIAIDAGDLTADFQKYANVPVFPYYDRVYLPNGMWDVMCKNGQDLLAGGITVQDYSDNMKLEYERLRAAQS